MLPGVNKLHGPELYFEASGVAGQPDTCLRVGAIRGKRPRSGFPVPQRRLGSIARATRSRGGKEKSSKPRRAAQVGPVGEEQYPERLAKLRTCWGLAPLCPVPVRGCLLFIHGGYKDLYRCRLTAGSREIQPALSLSWFFGICASRNNLAPRLGATLAPSGPNAMATAKTWRSYPAPTHPAAVLCDLIEPHHEGFGTVEFGQVRNRFQ
jgi:hypothetical protein